MVHMCNVISVVGVSEMAEPSIPFISTKKGSGRETRLAISGNVKLISKDGQQVEAELLDISIHGFRVRHATPAARERPRVSRDLSMGRSDRPRGLESRRYEVE